MIAKLYISQKSETVPKATKAEVAKRIYEVLRIRLDGAARHDICQYASENGWGLSELQIERQAPVDVGRVVGGGRGTVKPMRDIGGRMSTTFDMGA
jgi:hypothetical protein